MQLWFYDQKQKMFGFGFDIANDINCDLDIESGALFYVSGY